MGVKEFAEIYKRETGRSGSRRFARRLFAHENFVNRLDLNRQLDLNFKTMALEFNSSGDLLVSGGLDKQVTVSNWEAKCTTLSYDSGHSSCVLDTKIMPLTNDKRIVTASRDGQVRLGEVLEDGRVNTKNLGRDCGCVYRLVVEHENPHILYSCGEDGFLRHFDLRSSCAIELLRCSPFLKRKLSPQNIGLHAMAIDPRNPNYICTGGADVYARVYDIRTLSQNASRNIDKLVDSFSPQHMSDNYAMNCIQITGLAYSSLSELLVSYCDELIYLFQKNTGLGPSPASVPPEDLQKHGNPRVFFGHRNLDTLKGVKFFGPNDDYVLSGSSCGHIFIWKKNEAKLIRVIKGDARTLNQVEPHPHLPILATCGAEKNVKLWAPIENDTPPFPCNIEKIVESNRRGMDQLRNWLSCTSSGDSMF